jgi:hypothetical protein
MKKTWVTLRAVAWLACALTLILPALLAVAVRGVVKWVTLPIRYTTARVLREFVLAFMTALDVRREDLDDEGRGLLKEVDDLVSAKSWL